MAASRFFVASAILAVCLLPQAARTEQRGNLDLNQGNCNITVINTGSGNQNVSVPGGVCGDFIDPSKALRIRYVWLDAVSVSLLMAGKVESDLAKSIGARRYLIKNKVSDEVQLLINKFGSNLAQDGVKGDTVESMITADHSQPFNQFGRRMGTPKIDNAEETPLFPDVDAYLAIQNPPTFPRNYSMYYVDLDLANDAPAVMLWRVLGPELRTAAAIRIEVEGYYHTLPSLLFRGGDPMAKR
jgi:hypothetical protein